MQDDWWLAFLHANIETGLFAPCGFTYEKGQFMNEGPTRGVFNQRCNITHGPESVEFLET